MRDIRASLDNQAFSYGATQSAGNNAVLQLWNPAASGVLVLCDQLIVSAGGDTGVLVTDYGTAASNLTGQGASQYLGGAAAVAQFRQRDSVGVLGSVLFEIFPKVAGSNVRPIIFTRPIIVPPGRGLTVNAKTVSVALVASFFWREVAG